jgi:hypothetical protein
MALPKLAAAKYELTIPSTGDKVEYRPFLVKEEKLLLMSQQTGDTKDQIRAIKDIITNCTFGKVEASELPFFDLEYIFLQLRAKSVGESTKLSVTCPDDNETKVQIDINLSEIECVRNVEHKTTIELGNGVGVVMKYPQVDVMEKAGNIAEDASKAFDVIKSCIGQIYDSENVYDRKDMEEKELDEFIESMSHSQFEEMQQFFATMPRVKKTVKVKNPKTGVQSDIVLEGMASFF